MTWGFLARRLFEQSCIVWIKSTHWLRSAKIRHPQSNHLIAVNKCSTQLSYSWLASVFSRTLHKNLTLYQRPSTFWGCHAKPRTARTLRLTMMASSMHCRRNAGCTGRQTMSQGCRKFWGISAKVSIWTQASNSCLKRERWQVCCLQDRSQGDLNSQP